MNWQLFTRGAPSHQIAEKQGFSLVEIIVGMVLFALLAIGIASATLQSQRLAYQNIYKNTAFTVAQGYAEQIKSLGFNDVLSALIDHNNTPIPTKSLSTLGSSQTGDLEINDPLFFGQRNEKAVLIDIKRDASGNISHYQTMKVWITPEGDFLGNQTNSLGAIEISLLFEWQLDASTDRLGRQQINLVKTDISEY